MLLLWTELLTFWKGWFSTQLFMESRGSKLLLNACTNSYQNNLLKYIHYQKKERKKNSLPFVLQEKGHCKESPSLYDLDEILRCSSCLPITRRHTAPPCPHSLSHKLLAKLFVLVDQSGQNILLLHLTELQLATLPIGPLMWLTREQNPPTL